MTALKARIADHMKRAGPTRVGFITPLSRWIGFGVSFFIARGAQPLRVRECDRAKALEARLNEVTRYKVDELKAEASHDIRLIHTIGTWHQDRTML